ncbi:hypothetical protein EVAR_8152_1 [Eumeta japonica]|uniref:Uncharacterized protein n=1 Tax=Eumeta variegata TaxID=151549 RepID=A0A4C1TSY0_EUMVA|nr:hypothetical protein EVAR_8152_1 [Eumeta japonica]
MPCLAFCNREFVKPPLDRRMCRERSALMAAGESLVREVATLRADFDARANTFATDFNDKGSEELRRELEDERKGKAALKEKLAAAETQFKAMRVRVAKMDKQLQEAGATIASLTSTVKALEDQNRQRELQLETRARKLRESLKTGEMASSELQQQRNALLNELQDLKEQLANATSKHKSTVKELTEQTKGLKSALEDARRETQQELEKRMEVQHALSESHKQAEELREQLAQIEKKLPNPNIPTQREMNLWAELQSTKETLRISEDEITFCKKEKIRFLETLTKIADTDNKIGMQQKLAAELLNKEELIGNMQNQIKELKKSIKYNQEKVIQFEKYIDELHSQNTALIERNESPDGMNHQELHQQVMALRMSLLEAAQRNEDLTDILAHKEQELEQQDKTSRAQARVIKVREELIAMLKNKETEQTHQLTELQKDIEHRMKIVDDVNKQIAAKANEIQDLFATLESKQQQIRRLEKIILALEDQQRRAQAQRTRHEEKIAALEHELAASSNRRYPYK